MKQLLSFLMLLIGITAPAQSWEVTTSVFDYTYEGQSLYYEILDKDTKTCEVDRTSGLKGALIIPEKAEYEQSEYTVTSIKKGAFSYNYYLTSVLLPNSITYIGNEAFCNCSDLTSANIPNSVIYIGEKAFSGCRLTSVTIPNSITTIKKNTFSYCRYLPSVVIPNSVTTIEDNAFSECSSLTSVEMPNSVTTIGNYTFSGCSSLTSIDIPNSVTTIGNYTFDGCSSLISVVIPNSVTVIENNTFNGCNKLTAIYSLNPIPPTAEYDYYSSRYGFDDTNFQNATLYVPQEALEAYKTAEMWKEFKNIVGIDQTGVENVNIADKNTEKAYYDINGHKQNALIKGLNIVNGKKVIMK